MSHFLRVAKSGWTNQAGDRNHKHYKGFDSAGEC